LHQRRHSLNVDGPPGRHHRQPLAEGTALLPAIEVGEDAQEDGLGRFVPLLAPARAEDAHDDTADQGVELRDQGIARGTLPGEEQPHLLGTVIRRTVALEHDTSPLVKNPTPRPPPRSGEGEEDTLLLALSASGGGPGGGVLRSLNSPR